MMRCVSRLGALALKGLPIQSPAKISITRMDKEDETGNGGNERGQKEAYEQIQREIRT